MPVLFSWRKSCIWAWFETVFTRTWIWATIFSFYFPLWFFLSVYKIFVLMIFFFFSLPIMLLISIISTQKFTTDKSSINVFFILVFLVYIVCVSFIEVLMSDSFFSDYLHKNGKNGIQIYATCELEHNGSLSWRFNKSL